ncbi:transferase [Nostoc sp. PA-18-2419]|uniref:transferase n=1 Tax=Nostoc sp. PA-18-2419 TaxID=2575443 RepID=UPI001109B873|nr:transferase [Nostoc sp. PA-18-2419]
MSVPPLRLSNNFDSYISGEVSVDPSAVLAPGVILQAAANSRIVIGPGVCIGMGSILQVHEGTLEVEAGANLGAGFLMVGKGKIGANACIGSATTIFNCSVEPGQVIPPGSILGDTSRQINQTQQLNPSPNNPASTTAQSNHGLGEGEEKIISSTNLSASGFLELKGRSISFFKSPATSQTQSPPPEKPVNDADSSLQPPPQENPTVPTTESPNNFGTQIYGQGSIQRLLTTLFPHRQSLSDQNSDD